MSSRGIALITVLLVSSLVTTMALGLSVVMSVHHLVGRNQRESAALEAAAHAAVELAAHGVARADWTAVLSGLAQADNVDGAPWGTRVIDGGAEIDLAEESHLLNCGLRSPCSPAQLQAVTADRPWGANNPQWQLFFYGPLADQAPFVWSPAAYLLVWVAEDGRERDGLPGLDGAEGEAGHGVLRVHAAAVGRDGGRRAVEAELIRVCRPGPATPRCLPGIRVQSWRDSHHAVP